MTLLDQALVEEATKKSGLIWVRGPEGPAGRCGTCGTTAPSAWSATARCEQPLPSG